VLLNRSFLIVISLVAFSAKLVIAYNTYGTNDAVTFESDIRKLQSDGPERLYVEGVFKPNRANSPNGSTSPFSHSPFLIHALLGMEGLHIETGLPVRFWIRFFCAVGDLASVLIIWRMTGPSVALVLFAVNPVSLMISGFHVNTDPILALLLLLCAYLLCSGKHVAIAGIVLGCALSVKLIALLFAAAFVLYINTNKGRVIFLAASAAAFLVMSLPFALQFPSLIIRSILSYQGLRDLGAYPD
jgi:hypothetical protein